MYRFELYRGQFHGCHAWVRGGPVPYSFLFFFLMTDWARGPQKNGADYVAKVQIAATYRTAIETWIGGCAHLCEMSFFLPLHAKASILTTLCFRVKNKRQKRLQTIQPMHYDTGKMGKRREKKHETHPLTLLRCESPRVRCAEKEPWQKRVFKYECTSVNNRSMRICIHMYEVHKHTIYRSVTVSRPQKRNFPVTSCTYRSISGLMGSLLIKFDFRVVQIVTYVSTTATTTTTTPVGAFYCTSLYYIFLELYRHSHNRHCGLHHNVP